MNRVKDSLYKLGGTITLGRHGPRSPPAAAATSMQDPPCGGARRLSEAENHNRKEFTKI